MSTHTAASRSAAVPTSTTKRQGEASLGGSPTTHALATSSGDVEGHRSTSPAHEPGAHTTTTATPTLAATSGPGASRWTLQRLTARSPPNLARNSSGGDHSPAHQSNSTSPFFMGHGGDRGNVQGGSVVDDDDDGEHGSTAQRAGVNVNKTENSFNNRNPTRSLTHTSDVVDHPSTSPPDALLYPTNPDVREASLTAYEEAEPRGSASGIPAMVVLRHRMGFSTVVLTSHQRHRYNRYDLENFVLYKEQKYNAVNVLWRFSMLVLLMLTFSVFCLIFSTCTTEWVRLEHRDNYLSLGIFVACRDKSLRSCATRSSARLEWEVTDAVTGSTRCTASPSFVSRFIGAIWAMAILQLLCELIALALTAWIVSRPTRSGALVLLFFDLFLGTACGIVAVVLFHHYSACLRQTCRGEHLGGRLCNVTWRYGYKLYLGSLAVHGIVLLLALCMHSYIHNIRVTARKQLRAERRRASRRHEDAEEYMVHVMDDSDGERERDGATADEAVDRDFAAARAAAPARLALATRQPGAARGSSGGETPPEESPFPPPSLQTDHAPKHQQQQQQQRGGDDLLAHSSLHVSFAGVPGEHSQRPSPLLRHTRSARFPGSLLSPLSEAANGSRPLSSLRSASEMTTQSRSERSAVTASGPHQHHRKTSKQSRRRERRGRGRRDGSGQRRGSRHRHQHRQTSGSISSSTNAAATGKKRSSTDTTAYQQARKRSRFFVRFFNRAYDANYLTAAELGVPIDGADDWVYDDRSDMYYSFDRNMFWDPLTREYYNCALKTWQESPNQVLEVRDVLDYMLQESEAEAESDLCEDERKEEDVEVRDGSSSDADDGGGGPIGDHRERDTSEAHMMSALSRSSDAPQQPQQQRREPVTPATTSAVASGGLDSSAALGPAQSATSRPAQRGGGATEDEEPIFTASHESDSALHSLDSVSGRSCSKGV